ncbi:MAG: transposase, partial [Candidatus Aenigmatarchaeota archaeon]
YKEKFSFTIFSKVEPEALQELFNILAEKIFKNKQIKLFAIDSTDIPTYSAKDKDAKWGYRTTKRHEQILQKKKTIRFIGYKAIVMVDCETELPIAARVFPANVHDSKGFFPLWNNAKRFYFAEGAKFIVDAAFDSTEIYKEIRHHGIKPLIAINGRGRYKSRQPKDKDYGKRWAVERLFSWLKEKFDLAKNKFIGLKRVIKHVFCCFIAYFIKRLMRLNLNLV